MRIKKLVKAFTLPELMISVGILTIIFGIATISLGRSQRLSAQGAQIDTFFADLRDQQARAMEGYTEGAGAADVYGVHLEENSYTLYKSNYTAGNPQNFVVPLDPSLRFTNITFIDNNIAFTSHSGTLTEYVPGANSFSLEDLSNGEQINISINAYGVPIE